MSRSAPKEDKRPATTFERAQAYASKMFAVSGEGGHNSTFSLAMKLVHGFCLDDGQTLEILKAWNETNTVGEKWDRKQLEHKLKSAKETPPKEPRGWLLGKMVKRLTKPAQRRQVVVSSTDPPANAPPFVPMGKRGTADSVLRKVTADPEPPSESDEHGVDQLLLEGTSTPPTNVCKEAFDLGNPEAEVVVDWEMVTDPAAASALADRLDVSGKPVAIDLETAGENALDPWNSRPRLLQINTGDGPVIVDLWKTGESGKAVIDKLKDALLVGHNLGFDLAFLKLHFGFEAQAVFDTCVASRVLSNGLNIGNRLGDTMKRYMMIEMKKDQGGSDWGGDLTPRQLQYAADDVRHLLGLREILLEELEKEGLTITAKLEMCMVQVSTAMRMTGMPVCRDTLESHLNAKLKAIEEGLATIGEHAPEMNPASPKQVKEAFDDLYGIKLEKTDKEALHGIDKPLAKAILKYRKAKKAADKYKEILGAIKNDGRIHPDYKSQGAVTGRFSVAKPAIQNVNRGEMRQAVKAGDGRMIIAVDYSQIELRTAAIIAKDQGMLDAYRKSEDLHRKTAAIVLDKLEDEITGEQRTLAKAVNFGLLYGQRAPGLVRYAKNTYGVEMLLEDAEEFRDRWFDAYHGIREWHEDAWDDVRGGEEDAFTQIGRRRTVELDDGDGKNEWKRFTNLVNTTVQGTAADGMKLALWKLLKRLPEGAKLISTIHDEALVECRANQIEEVEAIIREVMVEAMSKVVVGIPIEVDASVGQTWPK